MPATKQQVKADFCLKIDFQKDSENPSRVFKAAYELIEALKEIDKCLMDVVDPHIEPVLLLEDVEAGSLKIWLKHLLEELDDEAIKTLDWKPQAGKYLLLAKYLIIDFCNKETRITNASQLAPLERDIFQSAQDSNANQLPYYRPISRKGLLEGMNKVSAALGNLNKEDKVSYITESQEVPFNLSFSVVPTVEELLTAEETKLEGTSVLKVKKPDFLGDSQWEFKHENRIVRAKILDAPWLEQYRSGQVYLLPGDAMKVEMEHLAQYDDRGNIVSEQYNILKVIKIVRNDTAEQQGVFNAGN